MEWLDRMNAAVDYIEANLSDEISYEKDSRCPALAAAAGKEKKGYSVEVWIPVVRK